MPRLPAKRAKSLPPGMICEHCAGPVRSLGGFKLAQNEYAVECVTGCWACECGEYHAKGDACPCLNVVSLARYRQPPAPVEDDGIPF